MRLDLVPATLLLLGLLAILFHAFFPEPHLPNLLLGSSWAAAVIGGFGLYHAARDARTRAALTGALLGAVFLFLAKGAYQSLVELPAMIAEFERNPEAMLSAQALDANSAAARMLERRLRQPDATGWFAMSNVFGSIAAVLGVALLALTIEAARAARDKLISSGEAGLLALGALSAAACLYFSASKGATAAAALGVAIVFALSFSARCRAVASRFAGWLPIAIIALALAAVALRGAIGDQLNELSLLFRWHYIIGASRVIADHPILGVGPAGFQDAYLLTRLPISPEEVESPHSIAFDLLARLGLGGAAWLALILIALIIAARRTLNPAPTLHREVPLPAPSPSGRGQGEGSLSFSKNFSISSSSSSSSSSFAVLSLLSLLPVSMSMFIERAALTPDVILLRLVALAGWLVTSFIITRLALRRPASLDIPLLAAAIVLAAHAQIETTPVIPNSAALFAAFLALAAAGARTTVPLTGPPVSANAPSQSCVQNAPGAGVHGSQRTPLRWAVPAVFTAHAAILLVFAARPALHWESELRAASTAIRPLADARSALARATALSSAAPPDAAGAQQAGREAFTILKRELARDIAATPEELGRAMFELQDRTVRAAADHLLAADRLMPSEPQPASRAIRLLIDHASAARATGAARATDELLDRATNLAREIASRQPLRSTAWGRAAAAHEAAAALRSGGADSPQSAADLASAAEAWRRAATFDPSGLSPGARLALTLARLNDPTAPVAARRALDINANMRLDPLKQLPKDIRDQLEAIAKSAPPSLREP